MYIQVDAVEPLEDYVLLLTFANGERRQFDVKPLLDWGVFSELRAQDRFNSVKVFADTIAWEGDIDLDPEYLYQHSTVV